MDETSGRKRVSIVALRRCAQSWRLCHSLNLKLKFEKPWSYASTKAHHNKTGADSLSRNGNQLLATVDQERAITHG
jgi:hypothetical protein